MPELRPVLATTEGTDAERVIALELLSQGYKARIEYLETALAGLCDAATENGTLYPGWKEKLGKALQVARDALAPS